MRTIRLYDTATGELRTLEPREPGRVGIYACGPTVYDRIHVGNARPFVVFSLLKRFLEHEGYDVTLVANVTDVNDKIYDAARTQGVGSEELAERMTAAYRADTDALGLGRPDHEPLASESIPGIVELIAALIEAGSAYAVEGDVYFRVRTDPRYGSLSGRDVDQMDQGEGVEGASRKEDPLDFALWKAEKPREDTAWDAPWGRGRPGWHVECSAMAEAVFGAGVDIHGGGIDLAFPHHENEAAQTRCARGHELAGIWMHNGMLETGAGAGGAKMSKSIGNVTLLPDVLAEHGRDALIALFVGGHYRQPLRFGPDPLADAAGRVRRIREAGRRLVAGPSPDWSAELLERFLAALADDFTTPAALAAVADWVSEANRADEPVGRDDLAVMLGLLGLEALLESAADGPAAELVALAEERARARAAKDFATSDRIRDELLAAGWVVRDGPDGPELLPAP
ncbi:MAG: cysteine--tRNA ligase [Solirubrobacterales bacterium]|nr:cysteine--tRNA ligase [Solirubrobacterales bacterium]